MMDNRTSNFSFLPYTQNTVHISTQLSIYLLITIGISSVSGTTFSILGLIRFVRQRYLRTRFNYLYHYMLFFCLSNSVIYVPSFYAGIYLSWFIISPIYCTLFLIHSYTILPGLAYLLLWASLERHRFLFQLNVTTSVSRQIFPLIIVSIFVYICSIIIILLPKCSNYTIYEACFIENIVYVILFISYTFIIPIVAMICSTIILLWRLTHHRARLNKHRRWMRLKRMFSQSIIYLGWYCLAYWPYTIYMLLAAYNPEQFNSFILKSTLYLISVYGIQMFPIITYFIFKSNRKQTQEKYALKNKTEINQINNRFKDPKQPPIIERF